MFTVTQELFYKEISNAVFNDLKEKLVKKENNHCMRVDFLPSPVMHTVCRLISENEELKSKEIEAYVLSESANESYEIESGSLIEKRNRQKFGVLLIFIPQGFRGAAEDSFDIHTFEKYDISGVLNSHRNEMIELLPEDDRENIHKILTNTATRKLPIEKHIKYLIALINDGSTLEEAGAYLHHLNLIPDLGLEADSIESRLSKNKICVDEISSVDKSIFLSIETLSSTKGLNPNENDLRNNLINFFKDRNSINVEEWTNDILADQELTQKLNFKKWKFKDIGVDIELYLTPLRNPDTGAIVDGIKLEGENLVASTTAPIKLQWKTNPPTTDKITQFLIIVESESVDSEESEELLRKPVKGTSRRVKLSLKDIDVEEGETILAKIRILAKDRTNTEIASDESESFYITGGEIIQGESKKSTKIRNKAEAVFYSTFKNRVNVEIDSEGWESGKINQYKIKTKTRGKESYSININPVLFDIQKLILENAYTNMILKLNMTNQSFVDLTNCSDITFKIESSELYNQFTDARFALFEKIKEGNDVVAIEILDLRDFKYEILDYADTYLKLLKDLRLKLEETQNESEKNNILNEASNILRLDTLQITMGDDEEQDELLLLSPTHPIKLLWLLQYQQLLYNWSEKLVGLTEEQARKAINPDSIAKITPLNIPSAISFNRGEFFINTDNIDLYWNILPKSNTKDIRRLITQLMRALGFKEGTGEITSITDEHIADRIWRYLKHHPYVETLKLNVINPGDGLLILNAIRRLQDEKEFKNLHYDITFYGNLGYELMGSAFDDMMDNSQNTEGTISDVDEELLQPNRNPIFPKLFFSKIKIKEEEWKEAKIKEAHITILIDRFTIKTLTRELGSDSDSFFLHNLLAEYRSDFNIIGESATWTRKVIPNQNKEIAEGDKTAESIYLLDDNILRLSSCYYDWGSSSNKLPAIQLELSDTDKHIISTIHEKSDWVFTIDRNFGIEYFDNPIDANPNVRSYLIDYSPEFIDGVGHRLIVSTFWLSEIEGLIKDGLKKVGILNAGYHATKILDVIKSISGRLALKLINNPNNAKEIIGLALTRLLLERDGSLKDGILIPVDSHTDLFSENKRRSIDEDLTIHRSDLILAKVKGNKLNLILMEVKFRSGSGIISEILALKDQIIQKNENTKKAIIGRYLETNEQIKIDKALTNKSLSNLLAFYYDRSIRHKLFGEDSLKQKEFKDLIRKVENNEYEVEFEMSGFIYHWEGESRDDERQSNNLIHIIGKKEICELLEIQEDEIIEVKEESELQKIEKEEIIEVAPYQPIVNLEEISDEGTTDTSVKETIKPEEQRTDTPIKSEEKIVLPVEPVNIPEPEKVIIPETEEKPIRIYLGKDCDTKREMFWDPFTTEPKKLANQHILIVGKPGAGKSQSASSFMYELAKLNIPFLVIDFQGEYISNLKNAKGIAFPELTNANILDASEGLEINPLEVPDDPITGRKMNFTKTVYQVASSLKKIFGLGDIQHSILRDAIQIAFNENGFRPSDKSSWDNKLPTLNQVWEVLKFKEETEGTRNLNLRIQPLFDTGVFIDSDASNTFDSIFKGNTILRLSNLATTELMVAVSRFVLQKVYNHMLSLGPTNELRMFIIIDEAHKLSYDETLTELIREARKYGIGIMLASQSVSDFDEVVFDAVGTKISLQLEGENAKIMADNMGMIDRTEINYARQIILNQDSFKGLIRNNHYEPYRQVQLIPFYKKE